MNFHLDCIPCFFRQALFSSRETGASPETQRRVLDALAELIPRLPMEASPPENSVHLYNIVHEILADDDPYRAIKAESNRAAMEIYPRLRERAENHRDPFLGALETAIAGNIIDYGAGNNLDLPGLLAGILEGPSIIPETSRHFDPPALKAAIKSAAEKNGKILYIGDNAGEIVFDRVFIEYLKGAFPGLDITYVVRGRPIINDVTMKDAEAAGMTGVCRCLSSGSPAPGTVLGLCSGEFLRELEAADMVISKGQGNYESLSGKGYPVYYLLRIKCPVLAEAISAATGKAGTPGRTPLGSLCAFRE